MWYKIHGLITVCTILDFLVEHPVSYILLLGTPILYDSYSFLERPKNNEYLLFLNTTFHYYTNYFIPYIIV